MGQGGGTAPTYDRFYYAHYFGADGNEEYKRDDRWLEFFGSIADRIVADIEPRTVLDAGCAMGFLVEALRDRGVEAYGIDVSDYALEQIREDIKPYCSRASVTDPLPQRYDLIVCIETLEHLTPADSERAAANLSAQTDDLLFSSTPSHFKEISHLNVRPPEYWAELFARQGMFHDVDYDPSTYVAPWAVRFRRRHDPAPRVAGDYERLLWRLRSENVGLRDLTFERQRELAEATHRLDEATRQLDVERAQLAEARGRLQAALVELDGARGELARSIPRRLLHRMLPARTRRGEVARSVRRRLRPGGPA
jgi:SAM-dependent methyltransferase